MKLIDVEIIGRQGDNFPFSMVLEFSELVEVDNKKDAKKKAIDAAMGIVEGVEYI